MLFFIQNILIFSIIFWGLTVLGSYFYNNNNHNSKSNFYECGFNSTSDLNFQINLNFIMICIFLVLYDIEFTFLFPILFNLGSTSIFQFMLFILFIFLMVISLYYDILMNALSWQY